MNSKYSPCQCNCAADSFLFPSSCYWLFKFLSHLYLTLIIAWNSQVNKVFCRRYRGIEDKFEETKTTGSETKKEKKKWMTVVSTTKSSYNSIDMWSNQARRLWGGGGESVIYILCFQDRYVQASICTPPPFVRINEGANTGTINQNPWWKWWRGPSH